MAQLVKRGENRWQVMVFRGRNELGKRQFHIKTIRGTKREAAAYARDVETKLTTGTFVEPTKQTVRAFLEMWLSGPASQRLREATLNSYTKLIRNYVAPAIGDLKLSQLRLTDVDTVYSSMRDRGLSPRTVRYTHAVLRTALNHAVRARLLPYNPSDHATLPRQEGREMRCLSPAEVVRFLDAAKDDHWYALFELLALTGLRPSEALGLRWSDISGNTISVMRALTRSRTSWHLAEPKTRRSRRTVPFSHTTAKALQAHRRRQAEEKLRAGVAYIDHEFVFANTFGGPVDLKNLTHRHFRKILLAAGLPTIRLYDLRHTAATLMLSAGVNPKVASERLGHSTITLTMDTYSHVLPDMQQDAIDRVDALLRTAST
jgi:integrase